MADPAIPPGFSRETTIRRNAHGVWFHDGQAVEHPGVREAFDRWIDRAEDGRYILKNDANWAYVEVEGAPVFVLRTHEGEGGFELELSDGRREPLRTDTLRQDAEGFLFCTVREGRLPAQFTVTALMDLETRLEEGDGGIALVTPGGDRVVPPTVEAPLEGPP